MNNRLMERPGVDTKRSKAPSFWGVTRSGADAAVDIGQTEYITRLTALRDSLIDQEQMYLAQALDRLRIHSLSNKSSSYRLRMNGDDVNKGSSSSGHAQTPRTNMVTTVEKFRQMRPKRHPPVIFPLQGRQLFDSHSHKDKDSSSVESQPKGNNPSNGSISNRTIKDVEISARSLPSKVDETVQANLQRLLQPTSSIPNIGRKALKKQQSFEPKTRALLYANDNSNGSNRFITRPRVTLPKRSPSLASPDTIIAAVTNSNNIYSMNNYYHSGSVTAGRRTGNDLQEETCSETDSVSGVGVGIFSSKVKDHHGGDVNTSVSYDPDSLSSLVAYDYYGNVNGKIHHNAELGHAQMNGLDRSHPVTGHRPGKQVGQNNNHVIQNANAEDGAREVKGHNECQSQLDTEDMENTPTQAYTNNHAEYNHGSTTITRKLYRSSGASEHNPITSKPPWQRAAHKDGGKSKHHASNYSSISTSRSDSQVGSTISGGHVSYKEGVRNSIDIFLPSHPFGTPFVRTESNLSRGDTGEGWTHVNNPSVESILPGTRFPAIASSQNRPQLQSQSQPQTSEGRRSRSSSRGESTTRSRQQKTSSLPNVRARYSLRRRSSSSEGFPEENDVRPWARVSQSQGGSRGRESNSVADDSTTGNQKRHIVVDMPSIIFNAASPEVGEASNSTPGNEVNHSPGQGSTPQSRTGQSSSAATPTTPSVPNLCKAVKQQEIRKRELQNLLEDVRELNIRTEVLSSQSAAQDGPDGEIEREIEIER